MSCDKLRKKGNNGSRATRESTPWPASSCAKMPAFLASIPLTCCTKPRGICVRRWLCYQHRSHCNSAHLSSTFYYLLATLYLGFPSGTGVKGMQSRRCKRPGFNPWVGKIPWGRKWQPIPGFLPEKLHGQKSLVGYSRWGRKELATTNSTQILYLVFVLCFIYIATFNLHSNVNAVGSINLILQMRKPRSWKVKKFTQGHKAS